MEQTLADMGLCGNEDLEPSPGMAGFPFGPFPVPPPISGGSNVKVPPSQTDSVKAVVGLWAWIKVVQSVSKIETIGYEISEYDFSVI